MTIHVLCIQGLSTNQLGDFVKQIRPLIILPMQEHLGFGQFPQNCLRFKCCLIQVNQILISNLLKRIQILHHYQVPIEFHVALIFQNVSLYHNVSYPLHISKLPTISAMATGKNCCLSWESIRVSALRGAHEKSVRAWKPRGFEVRCEKWWNMIHFLEFEYNTVNISKSSVCIMMFLYAFECFWDIDDFKRETMPVRWIKKQDLTL